MRELMKGRRRRHVARLMELKWGRKEEFKKLKKVQIELRRGNEDEEDGRW